MVSVLPWFNFFKPPGLQIHQQVISYAQSQKNQPMETHTMTILALKATDAEVEQVNALKLHFRQPSVSGVLRMLITDAYLKILSGKSSVDKRLDGPRPEILAMESTAHLYHED